MSEVLFYGKASCDTCAKARKSLRERGVEFREVDILSNIPPQQTLRKAIEKYGRRGAVRTRSTLYRERDMKDEIPPPEELIELMIKDPNLIKRPVITIGDEVYMGLDLEDVIKAKRASEEE